MSDEQTLADQCALVLAAKRASSAIKECFNGVGPSRWADLESAGEQLAKALKEI